MDIAGPLLKNETWNIIPGYFDGGVTPNVAKKTISMYTNPGHMGTKHFNKDQVNIKVNPDKYIQPRSKGNMYNHAFAVMLTASLCARTKCLDKGNKVNLNFFENPSIPDGTHTLIVNKCYPFCRKEDNMKP